MNRYVGRLLEFHLEPDGRWSPLIECPVKAVPAPGRYLLAHDPNDLDAVLAETLFLSRSHPAGFLAAPLDHPMPSSWQPGIQLKLRGPLGKGFHRLASIRHLALVAAGGTVARLFPLIEQAESTALFTDLPAPDLPAAVEVQPLAYLPDALPWADTIAIDIPLERYTRIADLLQVEPGSPRPPVQTLVTSPMPCGGLAECGVCALPRSRGKYRLLCKDGPVV